MSSQKLILSVPGPWATPQELQQKIERLDPPGSFLYGVDLIWNPAENDQCPAIFSGEEKDLPQDFRACCRDRMLLTVLDSLIWHRSVVRLQFEMDFLKERERIDRFTLALAKAEGLAVKLESTGLSYDWGWWFHFLRADVQAWYYVCVTLTKDDSLTDVVVPPGLTISSIGMMNFGMPDCAAPADDQETDALINKFNLQQLTDASSIKEQALFSLRPRSSKYRMRHVADSRYAPGEGFPNRQGIWLLERA
jgi:hypothetical protein